MDRKYVRLDRKRFHPEDVGIVVTDLLADVFLKVIDLGFTAEMEEDLDRIGQGLPWEPIVKTFFEEVEAPSPSARRRCRARGGDRRVSSHLRRGDRGQAGPASGAGTAGSFPAAATRTASAGAPQPVGRAGGREGRARADRRALPQVRRADDRAQGRFGPFLGCLRLPQVPGHQEPGRAVVRDLAPSAAKARSSPSGPSAARPSIAATAGPTATALWQAPLSQPCPSCGSLLALGSDPDTATCAARHPGPGVRAGQRLSPRLPHG